MSVALGRDLGSFWSMSSICVQVRGGRSEGGRRERRMMKEERGRGTGGKKRKEEKGTRRVKEQDGGRKKKEGEKEGVGSGKKMAQILKHVRALSTHQLLQFVTVVPLHWLKGNLQVIVTQQEMTSSDII